MDYQEYCGVVVGFSILIIWYTLLQVMVIQGIYTILLAYSVCTQVVAVDSGKLISFIPTEAPVSMPASVDRSRDIYIIVDFLIMFTFSI